jgi:hypothetical protein
MKSNVRFISIFMNSGDVFPASNPKAGRWRDQAGGNGVCPALRPGGGGFPLIAPSLCDIYLHTVYKPKHAHGNEKSGFNPLDGDFSVRVLRPAFAV